MSVYGKAALLTLVSASCGAAEDFAIIVVPDTQNYVSYMNDGMPETFTAQTQWIAQNREALNIVFVTHLGDLVARGDSSEAEWLAAEHSMGLLEDPATTGMSEGIPYGVALGNHDQSRGDGWLRIMQFSPDRGSVSVRTYSPTINDGAGGYLWRDSSEFELSIDFSRVE